MDIEGILKILLTKTLDRSIDWDMTVEGYRLDFSPEQTIILNSRDITFIQDGKKFKITGDFDYLLCLITERYKIDLTTQLWGDPEMYKEKSEQKS